MIQDHPKMSELEKMAVFCKQYPQIFIFGTADRQQLIAKYMKMAKLHFNGYLRSRANPDNNWNDPDLPILDILHTPFSEDEKQNQIGIILSNNDRHYTEIVSLLQDAGFRNFFFISEERKQVISHKMTPYPKERFRFEVNLADHCNLNCQCCDHFSPLAKPAFLDFEQYERDVRRLAELSEHKMERATLLGGEPLLNDRLIDYIRVTREAYPQAHIAVFTNGLLLDKWGKERGLWEVVNEYDVEFNVTVYPIDVDFDPVKEALEQHHIPYSEQGVSLHYNKNRKALVHFLYDVNPFEHDRVKWSTRHPFDLNGMQEPFQFANCYHFNECITLRNGHLYTCPIIPYSSFFNEYFHQNLETSLEDSVDIYSVKSYEELVERLTRRPPFCRYCKVQCRCRIKWKQSEHSIEEWS